MNFQHHLAMNARMCSDNYRRFSEAADIIEKEIYK